MRYRARAFRQRPADERLRSRLDPPAAPVPARMHRNSAMRHAIRAELGSACTLMRQDDRFAGHGTDARMHPAGVDIVDQTLGARCVHRFSALVDLRLLANRNCTNKTTVRDSRAGSPSLLQQSQMLAFSAVAFIRAARSCEFLQRGAYGTTRDSSRTRGVVASECELCAATLARRTSFSAALRRT